MSTDTTQVKTPDSKDSPEVEQELSQVATNPKQSILILVVVVAVFAYLFFNLFINSSDVDNNKNTTPVPDEVSKPVQVSTDSDIPSIPTLPAPPKLEEPTPPPPPSETDSFPVAEQSLPSLPSVPGTELSTPEINSAPILPFGKVQDENAQKRLEAKRKSSIVLVAGVAPTKTPEQLQQEADFSYRGDMNLVLGRGKIVDAIIETAVNTDFGGEIRAIVTKDTYSEWGKNILLPKGSRIFGNYATGISGAYGRISIEWTRIDLANGYTLNLSGMGIDNLGRKGNQGRVDNKFKERFSNAILRSAFNIALAKTMDSIVPPPVNSQAAASQTQTATSIKNVADRIILEPTTPAEKFEKICAEVPATIADKTSTAFTQVTGACDTLRLNPAGDPASKLLSLMSAINSSSTGLAQNAATNVQPSLAQAASKQAVTDLSDTVKKLVDEQELKPTITLDQGTPVKIYVNKDYKFPKAAVSKSRSIK